MRTTRQVVTPARAALAAALAAAASLVLAPAAPAKGASGGGKGGASSSISAPIDETVHADGLIHHGDWITFTISTTATTQPWVALTCSQGKTLVLSGKDGYFDGALGTREFGLTTAVWTSGAATCTAKLETPSATVLASVSFGVAA